MVGNYIANSFIKRLRILLLGFFLPFSPLVHAQVQQAFLVQNSGWMEPYYVDPQSPLKPLVAAVIDAAGETGDKLFVAAFNQQTESNPSPFWVYPDARGLTPRQALDAIGLARKTPRGALADTDFQEAVYKTITEAFQAKPGIIWIFTNNKNSPGNDLDTAKRNREFYNLLHNQQALVRTLVFPLTMPVRGELYSNRGLMVYALAYGAQAEQALLRCIEKPAFRQVLTALPARLKPLDTEAVRIVPKGIVDAENVDIYLASDRKTIILKMNASEDLARVTFKADIENLFYPYRIKSAPLAARFLDASGSAVLAVKPANLTELAPNQVQTALIDLPIPQAQIPSAWSMAVIKNLGTTLSLSGHLVVELTQQVLELEAAFSDRLRRDFPGDPIEDLLKPPENKTPSSDTFPLVIQVVYPVYPLLFMLIAALLVLLLGFWLGSRFLRPVTCTVLADASKQTRRLSLGESQKVTNAQGELVGEIGRGMGKVRIRQVAPGHRLQLMD